MSDGTRTRDRLDQDRRVWGDGRRGIPRRAEVVNDALREYCHPVFYGHRCGPVLPVIAGGDEVRIAWLASPSRQLDNTPFVPPDRARVRALVLIRRR